MADETILSQTSPKEPLPGGAVYIGMSNTRGVIMQIHLQRFQQPLFANLAGLGATGGWLTSGEHSQTALYACAIGCLFVLYLNAFWIRLLKDTTLNLASWSESIIMLVFELGIKDFMDPGSRMERPQPRVEPRQLYRVLKQCNIAWGLMFLATLAMILNQRGGTQWLIWKLDLWLFWPYVV